jgi:hypothetical protein
VCNTLHSVLKIWWRDFSFSKFLYTSALFADKTGRTLLDERSLHQKKPMLSFVGFMRRELTIENTSLMAMTSEQIVGVVNYAYQKKLKLKWHFKKGKTRIARIIKITGTTILVEEKTIWMPKARLIDVVELFSVSFI